MSKQNRRRASKHLKMPATPKQLKRFANSIPTRASLRLITVESASSFAKSELPKKEKPRRGEYLEAIWWETKSEDDPKNRK